MRLFFPVIGVGIQRRGGGAEVAIGKKTESGRNNSIASWRRSVADDTRAFSLGLTDMICDMCGVAETTWKVRNLVKFHINISSMVIANKARYGQLCFLQTASTSFNTRRS